MRKTSHIFGQRPLLILKVDTVGARRRVEYRNHVEARRPGHTLGRRAGALRNDGEGEKDESKNDVRNGTKEAGPLHELLPPVIQYVDRPENIRGQGDPVILEFFGKFWTDSGRLELAKMLSGAIDPG